jgi:class 3 adenylate cyclase
MKIIPDESVQENGVESVAKSVEIKVEFVKVPKTNSLRLKVIERNKTLKAIMSASNFTTHLRKKVNPVETARNEMAELNCVSVDRWFVRFAASSTRGEKQVLELEELFVRSAAERHSGLMRWISILSTVFIVIAGIVDFGEARRKGELDQASFQFVIGCKLGIMAPIGCLVIWYTHSRYYISHTRYLGYILFLLGVSVCLWGQTRVNTQQKDKDTRSLFYALFILLVFCFTPCRFRVAALINFLMLVAFAVLTALESTGSTKDSWNYLTMLTLSYLVVGYRSYCQQVLWMTHHLQRALFDVQSCLLIQQQKQSASLLHSMLPAEIVSMMKQGGSIGDDGAVTSNHSVARDFADVTVIFCMISQFDQLASKLSPEQLVTVLNIIYTNFDHLIERHKVHKVETVGEVYLVAAGLPTSSSTHAVEAAEYALAMLAVMPLIRLEVVAALEECGVNGLGHDLQIQVGLDSGPLVTGVVGTTNVRYKLFGDVVNTASRMESTGAPGYVQVSNGTHSRLERTPAVSFTFDKREPIKVKGKGMMQVLINHCYALCTLINHCYTVCTLINHCYTVCTLINHLPLCRLTFSRPC